MYPPHSKDPLHFSKHSAEFYQPDLTALKIRQAAAQQSLEKMGVTSFWDENGVDLDELEAKQHTSRDWIQAAI
jgi:hypothetical protein